VERYSVEIEDQIAPEEIGNPVRIKQTGNRADQLLVGSEVSSEFEVCHRAGTYGLSVELISISVRSATGLYSASRVLPL
jgi:hypothetical protein